MLVGLHAWILGSWQLGRDSRESHCLPCPPSKNVTVIETSPDFLPYSLSPKQLRKT